MDHRGSLELFVDAAGDVFGTEDFSLFLQSFVRMQMPEVIVELGTGLAVSAISMALAVKRNGKGHVWTIDSGDYFVSHQSRVEEVCSKLNLDGLRTIGGVLSGTFYKVLAGHFEVESYVTFIKSKIVLGELDHFDAYPFATQRIDLLFSDFVHDPFAVIALLGHFLPRMSPSSSIFIDSASTLWPSYLLLENLVAQWNMGRVPKSLQDACLSDLSELSRTTRLVLVHITERKDRSQNSTTWIKLEPNDFIPHPRTRMRNIGHDLRDPISSR